MNTHRRFMQRLIIAYEAGRKVDLGSIFKHELLPVPFTLTEINGTLNNGSKDVLIHEVTAQIDILEEIEMARPSSQIIIDRQAMVVSLGTAQKSRNFWRFRRNLCKECDAFKWYLQNN